MRMRNVLHLNAPQEIELEKLIDARLDELSEETRSMKIDSAQPRIPLNSKTYAIKPGPRKSQTSTEESLERRAD
jgi:hypothetical protein